MEGNNLHSSKLEEPRSRDAAVCKYGPSSNALSCESSTTRASVGCDNRTMSILGELNRIYEERLADIDHQTNGNFELKYITYKEWVEMLLKLIKDLIEVVNELEYEASSRIELLERKLQMESSSCTATDLGKLKNDVSNLVELIHRALETRQWNLDGLKFCTLKIKDIFGANTDLSDSSSLQDSPPKTEAAECRKLTSQILARNHEIKRLESEKHRLFTELQCKDLLLSNYKCKVKELEKALCSSKDRKKPFTTEQEELLTSTEEDEVFKVCIAELKDCLREKETQLADKLKQNECLQTELRLYKSQAAQKDKAIANMRALAFEVADKHDQITQMRNQVISLEEELKKAHKKVQFKDNVIRELRREVKNSTKRDSPLRALSPTPCRCGKARSDSDTDRQSYKSIHFQDVINTDRSDNTMNTVIETEMTKFSDSLSTNEDRYIKILKEELEKFFDYQSNHNNFVEDQKRVLITQHSKLRELVNKMLCELAKNRNKLVYVRNRLISMSSGNEISQLSVKNGDSGYISPEDIEPECHLIETLRYRMTELRDENDSLKEQIQKLNTDMVSLTSSDCGKPDVPDYNEKLLQEVASALSNICGKEISVESSSIRFEACEGQVHPICQAVMNLENELNEKKKMLRNTKEALSKKDCELKQTQCDLYKLEEECDNKNHQICELQKAVDYHTDSFERLQCAKQNLESELAALKKMIEDSDYKNLLDTKNRLTIECENQITTINNLRLALENMKKTGDSSTNQNAQAGNAPSNVNLGNPLWGWWRSNNVHDI